MHIAYHNGINGLKEKGDMCFFCVQKVQDIQYYKKKKGPEGRKKREAVLVQRNSICGSKR